jgi:predicted neutral ceramidase superfamily lipid hydrolase
LNQTVLSDVERCMTETLSADRLPAGIAIAACVVALFLPWEHNSISGTKTGFELLGSSSEGYVLALFLVSIAVATAATLTRHALVAIVSVVASAFFLLREAAAIRSHWTISIGRDGLGRVAEFESISKLGAGFFVAAGLVVLIGGGALGISLKRRATD